MLFALGVRFHEVGIGDWQIGLWGALLCPVVGVAAALLVRPWLDFAPCRTLRLLLFAALPQAVLELSDRRTLQSGTRKWGTLVLVGDLGSLIAVPAVLYFSLP